VFYKKTQLNYQKGDIISGDWLGQLMVKVSKGVFSNAGVSSKGYRYKKLKQGALFKSACR